MSDSHRAGEKLHSLSMARILKKLNFDTRSKETVAKKDKSPKQVTFEEAMAIWKGMSQVQQLILRKLAVKQMIERGCEEIGTSDVNWQVYDIIKNEDYKKLLSSFNMRVPFGELENGDLFCLSVGHPEYGKQFLNVKMQGFGVYRGKDGKTITTSETYPFNVIELGTGSPRTFLNDEMVYKVTIKADTFSDMNDIEG